MKTTNKITSGLAMMASIITGCSTTGASNKASVELEPRKDGPMIVQYVQTNGSVSITATNVGKVVLADRSRTSAKQLLSVTALKGFSYSRTNTLGGVVSSSIASSDADPDAEAITSTGGAIGEAISSVIQP